MNEKNLPDDIISKSLNELTELANEIIQKLENEKDLENSVNEYQKLLKLNNLIEKKFHMTNKEISEDTKFKYLWDNKEIFETAGKIIIACDDDPSGSAMSEASDSDTPATRTTGGTNALSTASIRNRTRGPTRTPTWATTSRATTPRASSPLTAAWPGATARGWKTASATRHATSRSAIMTARTATLASVSATRRRTARTTAAR